MENNRQLWLLTVLAVVAVVVGGYFVLISPKTKKASAIRADAAAAESANRQIQSQIAMLKQQAKQLPREQARLAELEKKMPKNPALPSLIRSISDSADKTNVWLHMINPIKPTLVAPAVGVGAPTAAAPATPTGTGTAGTGTTVAGTTVAGQPAAPLPTLGSMPMEIKVEGHFAELQEFLASLEDLQRAFLVFGVQIKPVCRTDSGDPPPEECDDRLLKMTLNARVFMTVTQPAPAVAVAPRVPATSTTEGK